MRLLKCVGVAMVLVALPVGELWAASDKCPSKVKAADGPAGYAYVEELDYCEGLYRANVSSDLRVVGYYDLSGGAPAILYKVTGAGGGAFELRALGREAVNRFGSISIRGLSLDKSLLYLFDARAGSESVIVWQPSSRLEADMKASPEVGFYGFVGGEDSPRYVPLAIESVSRSADGESTAESPDAGTASPIALKVRTPDALEGFSWEVLDEQGTLIHEGWEDQLVLRNGVFDVMIPRGHGNVRVDVSADRKTSDRFIEKTFKAYSP